MDFEARLRKAIEKGRHAGETQAEEAARQAMTEEELKRLHASQRLVVSEHIEENLHKLEQQMPGFRFEPVVSDRGWGGAVSRDDLVIERGTGRRRSLFSRLEMTVRPLSSAQVLEVTARGAVRNKEALTRSYYEQLDEAEPDTFNRMVDNWILEYAELYARQT